MKASEISELVGYLKPEERAEVQTWLADDAGFWRPLPGPQSLAYHSPADITGYGGAAGGGKSDLACGLALNRHRRSIIFRRAGTEIAALEDRFEELLGSREGYNASKMIWRVAPPRGSMESGRQIEFGSCPHEGDERKYQGRPHDLVVIDEAANFLESQVRFLFGWLRTTVFAQRCRALLTFNPPTSAEGRWLIAFFAPWLDPAHPNPAAAGELRWYAMCDGKETEVPDSRRFKLVDGERVYVLSNADHAAGVVIHPMSRTFIPSRVTDNPHLTGTNYIRQLQGLPEPLRSQMLHGDFQAGVEDDPWQVIPTPWIAAAQARWAARDARGPMDAMGVDPARGGRDKTIIARRHGCWFDELVALPGTAAPDGPTVAGQVIALRRDRAPVHIDIVGWGASPYDFLVENRVQANGVNGAAASKASAREGDLSFANLRAELWWRLREALDPRSPEPIALPPDSALRADLAAPRWRLSARGVQVELKEEIRKRLGRSPDRGDAVALALIAAPKLDARTTRIVMPDYGAV